MNNQLPSAVPMAVAKQSEKRRLSMTFLLGPTGSTRTGGAACILEYARRFQERGHQVSIATWPKFLWSGNEPFPGLDFSIPIYYDEKKGPESLPFHLINQSPRDCLGELNFFTAYLNLLTPVIPRSDVLIAANWDAVIPAWQSGKGKVVHFPQHYDEVFFTLDGAANVSLQGNPLIKMLCRNAFQMPVYRIANSSWLANEFRRRFGEHVPVVTHGVDTRRFYQMPKLSQKDGVIRIVTYSRPEKWKGFQDAIPAVAELKKRHPGRIEWHVYGFAHPIGPENPLAPYKFHGALGHDQLCRLYAESDIVLCPSWYESFPLPPIEAMACGTAVVTTRYGTEDYAIDGHTAVVVRPRVVVDFVNALDALVRQPGLRERLARNGRAMAESLTWDGAVAAREELLWRIHRNQMPHSAAFQGFDTDIPDGYGRSFERLIAEVSGGDGQLFKGADGKFYLVDAGRLRRLPDPAALGADISRARPVDLLTLARNEHGPDIVSAADYYGFRA